MNHASAKSSSATRKKSAIDNLQLLVIAALAFAVDQLTKWVVDRRQAGWSRSLGRFIHFRVTDNVTNSVWMSRILLMVWLIAGASIWVLVGLGTNFDNLVARVGLGLALGGAAGNLFDRIRRGKIIDFIEVGLWPAFNLADLAIVVGLPLAFAQYLWVTL